MPTFNFPQGRSIDLVCLGRLAVDLYAQQFGSRLEDARSMAMYLGGSSANQAFGVARLGLKSAMISRVGNEQMGRFLTETLEREGCDTSQVQIDDARLTALVLLGLKDRDTFPLLFVRENCADMAIDAAAISEDFIAQSRCLAITGTHLSTPGTRAASAAALGYAKKHGVIRVLDIDYRPVLWGLTSRGAGENRYVADDRVTQQLQEMLGEFDLLVGTEEEFLIAGGVADDLVTSLRAVRTVSQATLVVKRGALGCSVIAGDIPFHIDGAPCFKGERVEVLNVLGAGDAFLSGLLASLLRGKDWVDATEIANACGAIVVSRHACSAAMPTQAELAHWLGGSRNPKVDADAQLAHLHRVSVKRKAWNELCVMAYDHRSQFRDMAREAGAGESKIPFLKKLLVLATEKVELECQLQGHTGVLIDGGSMGLDALASATGRGWWVGRPVELPGSRPLRFDETHSIGSALIHWPTEHVAKCLVHYHPDDAEALRLEQEARVRELWEATRASGNELLLEIILPKDSVQAGEEDAAVLRAIARFYDLGIQPEWWKLAPMQESGWAVLQKLLDARDPYCRGAVILGLNKPLQYLADSFANASNLVVKGFMVGRSLWADASLRWLKSELNDQGFIDEFAANYAFLVHAWRSRTSAGTNSHRMKSC
jgi:5-dehydro-2-deoxygluconokinase